MEHQGNLNIFILTKDNFVKEILEQIFPRVKLTVIRGDLDLLEDLTQCKNSVLIADKEIQNEVLNEFIPIVEYGDRQQNKKSFFIKTPYKYIGLQTKIDQAFSVINSSRQYLTINRKTFLFLGKKQVVFINKGKCSTVDLTEKEVELLKFIYSQPNMRASKLLIQQKVFGYNSDIDSHTVETHIYRVRNKKQWLRDLIIFEGHNNYSLLQEQ